MNCDARLWCDAKCDVMCDADVDKMAFDVSCKASRLSFLCAKIQGSRFEAGGQVGNTMSKKTKNLFLSIDLLTLDELFIEEYFHPLQIDKEPSYSPRVSSKYLSVRSV